MVCNPTGGSITGLGWQQSPYATNWGAQGNCLFQYVCNCGYPQKAKYRCDSGGSTTKVVNDSPDCCLFCNTYHPDPAPIFSIATIDINPASCSIGDIVTITAHVSNSGTAAGTSEVSFYWSSSGAQIGQTITTPSINVNTTVAATPIVVAATASGTFSICADVQPSP
jgi:hypothetical protein